jgi:O-antigen/teichoic acid export membrane protein
MIKIPWKTDILPVQWRLAGTNVFSFFILHMFSPIIFRYFGSIQAGKVGLVFFIFGVMNSFNWIYLNAYLPQFGMLLARKNFKERNALFFRVLGITVFLAIVLSIGLITVVHLTDWLGFHMLADRILSYPFLEFFALGNLFVCIMYPFAVYMRSYKKEPFFVYYAVNAVLVVSSLFIFSSRHNLYGISFSYMLISFFMLFWAVLLWRKHRNRERKLQFQEIL